MSDDFDDVGSDAARLRELVPTAEKELEDHFSRHPLYEVDRFIVNGAYGINVLIKEKSERTGVILRRVVLKRDLAVDFEEGLRTEINYLKVHPCFAALAMLSSYEVIHTNTEVSLDTTGCSAHRTVDQFDRQPFADHRAQPHEKDKSLGLNCWALKQTGGGEP